ncbi:MAG TPA: hypothetical protein VMV44_14620 [Rectinemataceae bacterium]|nr:hypothetical protein [Rectinemataceae bacterium]
MKRLSAVIMLALGASAFGQAYRPATIGDAMAVLSLGAGAFATILGIVILVCFFVLCSNVAKIADNTKTIADALREEARIRNNSAP